MFKILKLVAAGIACTIVSDYISKKIKELLFKDEKSFFMSMKVVPDSDSEKRFLKVFSNNSDKFIGMKVRLADVFGKPYNEYVFRINPNNIGILDGFVIEF